MSSQSVHQIRGADLEAPLHKPKCSRKEEYFNSDTNAANYPLSPSKPLIPSNFSSKPTDNRESRKTRNKILNPQLASINKNLLILCVMQTICKIWDCSDKKVRSDSSSWGQCMFLKLGVISQVIGKWSTYVSNSHMGHFHIK